MWKIALCQIDIKFGEPEANFKKVRRALAEAAEKGATVAVLPEMWNTGYALTELGSLADSHGERTKRFLSEIAAEHSLNIVGGSVSVKDDGKFANVMYAFDAHGDFLSSYKKVHLFQLMDEHLFLEAGNDTNLFLLNDAKAAGFICYDLRFPEWFRAHTARGAEVLFIAAEWPSERIHDWEKLAVARAIENQAFVVAVNRVGKDPKNEFGGHSLVVDPSGKILLQADRSEGNFYTTIDLSEIKKVRARIPVFEDRRPELY